MAIDHENAHDLLQAALGVAERAFLSSNDVGTIPAQVSDAINTIFASRTQAFREALLGCLIARIQDKAIDIRKPYISQGANAYSGRRLDELIVNPLLQEKRIPATKGAFLSVFRRSVEFDLSTRGGLRDKSAYDAFLTVIEFMENTSDDEKLRQLLNYMALEFVKLREVANVPLTRIQRMSLEQVTDLVTRLLNSPSGGRLPVYVVVAAFHAIDRYFERGWDIRWQGINVSDTASGVGGDVVIMLDDSVLLAAEVTERLVDRNRVIATFNSKIGPQGIKDYLFFVNTVSQPSDSVQQVRQYFAQGHEINFVVIVDWLAAVAATIGSQGRMHFIERLLELLELRETPAAVKVAWNESVNAVIGN